MHLHIGISEPVYLIRLSGVVLVGVIQSSLSMKLVFSKGLRSIESSGIYMFGRIFAGCVRVCHLNQMYRFADC